MMKVTPRLLVATVLLWMVTVAVQSRAATDSGEPEIEESSESSPDPSVLMVPIRQLTDPNSAFTRILNNKLLEMSEQDPQAVDTGPTGTKTETSSNDDQDMMMGDMPSADDPQVYPQNSSSPATTFERGTVMPDNYSDEMSHKEKDSRERLGRIQSQMMINLRGVRPILPSMPVTKTGLISSYPTYTLIEKTQSFYPTCDLPKHTSEEVWNTKESMNLMFNISLPKSSKGITVNVNTARLRLYKQLVSDYSQTSNDFDDHQTSESTLFVESKAKTNLSTSGVVPIKMDNRLIRVSIYLNTRSLKRKRVKRKLLDSHMVPYYSEEWTEWNIRNAVEFWHGNLVRNYGIGVEVEDEDYNLLPVAKFFRTMNCSGDAQMMTSKPVQGFPMEAMQNGYSNPTTTTNNSNTNTVDAIAFRFNMHRYPMMDVTSIEIPRQEDQVAELEHRILNGSLQHRNNGTVPGSMSIDGHEHEPSLKV